MATATLTKHRPTQVRQHQFRFEVLAGGKAKTPVILALDLRPAHRLGRAQPRRRDRQRHPRVPSRPVRGRRHDLAALPRLAAGDRRDLGRRRRGGVRGSAAGISAPRGHAFGGYLAHLTAWAEANKIPYQGVPVGAIKRHIAGKGNADKAAVIDAVRKLGFQPADDNEADALALLDWAIAQGIGGAR